MGRDQRKSRMVVQRCTIAVTAVGEMVQRAKRAQRKGKGRKAMLLLRDACHHDESDPRLWALYGVQCARVGKEREALMALEQAIWLRDKFRQPKRAAALRGMLSRLRLVRAA